jgi:hypothetical protein
MSTASFTVIVLTSSSLGCRELLRNPEVMRRMLDPSNIQAMAQMRQAMDQLSAAGLGPNLGGLGGAGMGGGLGDLSGLLGGLPTGVPPVANPTEVYANELQQLVVSNFSLLPVSYGVYSWRAPLLRTLHRHMLMKCSSLCAGAPP